MTGTAAATAGSIACVMLSGCSLFAPFEEERHEKALSADRNQAFLAVRRKKYAEAERLYMQAAAEAQALGNDRAKATACKELGDVYLSEGKLKEAETCYLDFFKLLSRPTADDATDYARARAALGRALEGQGRLDEAEQAFKQAFLYADNLESGGYAIRHELRRDYVRFLRKVNKLAEAKKVESEETAMLMTGSYEFDSEGDDRSAYLKTERWNDICDQAMKEKLHGNKAAAERLLKQALKIAGSSGKPDRKVQRTYEQLGDLYLETERPAMAESMYNKQLAELGKVLRADDIMYAKPYESLGLAYCAQKKYQPGELSYKHALAIYSNTYGEGDKHTVACQFLLAEFYRSRGRQAEADLLYKKIADSGSDSPEMKTTAFASGLESAADALCRKGCGAEAAPYFRLCLAIRKNLDPRDAHLESLATKISEAAGKAKPK